MIIEGLTAAEHVAAWWELTAALARGQPLGAAVVVLLLTDAVLSAAGAVADRWEAGPSRRIKSDRPSRSASAPPACGSAAGR